MPASTQFRTGKTTMTRVNTPTSREKTWLTVVMPIYRGERWIEACLQSVADQTVPGIELIVIDSSPDEHTAAIVRSFSDRLHIRLEAGSLLPSWQSKTNHAVRIASADHICWLHHDDLWLPGRVAELRRWIQGAPEAVLHLAGSAIIDETGRKLGMWRCPFGHDGAIDNQQLLERLLVQNFISAPAPVFRKDAWLACGGIDEELWYTGDWDIWLKLAEKGAVYHHPAIATAFRVHGASLTVTGSRDGEDFERQMRIVLERHLSKLNVHRSAVSRASGASIKFNRALASAASGRTGELLPAIGRLLLLGPRGLRRYVRDSRIIDRLLPRLRAKLMGSF
jgi:glycosyltransferase involved in cell wall biosynthesis